MANTSKGNIDGAISDYNQALELNPKLADAYFNRGFARQLQGDFEGALSDFLHYDELAPEGKSHDYPQLYIWLIRTRLGQTAAASQELTSYLEKRWDTAPADWISKIGGFLLDNISEADFFAAASSTDPKRERTQHCEAWYYAGMKHLLAGDKKTAADYFSRCSATQDPSSDAYTFAESELKAVQSVGMSRCAKTELTRDGILEIRRIKNDCDQTRPWITGQEVLAARLGDRKRICISNLTNLFFLLV